MDVAILSVALSRDSSLASSSRLARFARSPHVDNHASTDKILAGDFESTVPVPSKAIDDVGMGI